MTDLAKLIAYTVWSNGESITFLDGNFPSDEYLLTRLSHILLGEQAWFQRILDQEPDRNIWRMLTISLLRDSHTKHKGIYSELLAGNLERVIAYKRFTGEEHRSNRARPQ